MQETKKNAPDRENKTTGEWSPQLLCLILMTTFHVYSLNWNRPSWSTENESEEPRRVDWALKEQTAVDGKWWCLRSGAVLWASLSVPAAVERTVCCLPLALLCSALLSVSCPIPTVFCSNAKNSHRLSFQRHKVNTASSTRVSVCVWFCAYCWLINRTGLWQLKLITAPGSAARVLEEKQKQIV